LSDKDRFSGERAVDWKFNNPKPLPANLSDRLEIGKAAWEEESLKSIGKWKSREGGANAVFAQLNSAALMALEKMSQRKKQQILDKFNLGTGQVPKFL
jgi:hypothetical protein